MSKRFAVGLDFGTESGRVMLVSLENGEEAAWAVVPYPNGVLDRQLPDGTPLGHDWALQDPRDYLTVLREGVPKVLRESGVSPGEVAGAGVSFTSCTMLPTLKDGSPLCTYPRFASNPHAWVKLWKHHAAQPEAEKIMEVSRKFGGKFLRIYNGNYSAEWFFSKVLETAVHAPEVYEAAERFIEAADWIVWQMTGNERRNECCAGYKGLWVKGEGFPPPDFFEALHPAMRDVVAEKLATDFYPPGTKAGGLTAEMARISGLEEGTPVAVGVIDAHAAVPACGVTEAGALVMIMGTSLCHMLPAEERRFVEGVAGVVEDGIVPGLWGYEAGQAAVGDLYAWFFRTFSADPETTTRQAAQLRPGQSGLLALDWWNGSRSVLMNADLSGLLAGATLNTTPGEIYRALVEATAFGTRNVIRAFETEGIPVERLVACGGLAEKSPLVMQIFADVNNRRIFLPKSLQASGLGAAMYGAVAGGAFRDIREAARQMAGLQDRSYAPDAESHAVYCKLYEEYLCLHDYFGRGANEVMLRLKSLKRSAAPQG
jgi:L-ribulokinase